MMKLQPEGIEDYIVRHSAPESELLGRLRVETRAKLESPQMQVGPVEGAFLRLVVTMVGARRVLEVGTFSGYSAISMAMALPQDGRLITCDVDPKATEIARRYFDESGYGDKIEIRLGPAKDTIAELREAGATFDAVFLDADKERYVDYWEGVLPMLPSGGIVLADNTLWGGRVLNPEHPSDHGIARFNAHVASDARVEHVLLSIRDGIMLARKR